MQSDFPKTENKYIRTEVFQDQEVPLTFIGWDKKANEDRTIKGQTKSWKDNLKYCLRYSYPEFAIDPTTGEKRLDKNDKPFKNKYWDPNHPKGYSIVYFFEEGQLESGSLPLFEAFCMVRPSKGDQLVIGKTGKDKETKWKVKKVSKEHKQASLGDLPEIQLEDLAGQTDEIPF